MTTYTAKNVLLQLEDGTKILPYTDKTSKGMEDIDTSGEDKLIASEVYKDGILSDARGAETLEAEKRSTFDKSKFTIVGSPVITNAGIASGFSTNNYLTANSTSDVVSYISNVIIETPEIILTDITREHQQYALTNLNNNYSYVEMMYSSNMFYCRVYIRNNSTSNITSLILSTPVVTNDRVQAKVVFGTTQFEIYLYKNGNLVDNKVSEKYSTINLFCLGYRFGRHSNSSDYHFDGSIDLKQFSITVDGVEVFNGNKTGIDKIKKDDYTIVGSPTITDDGIASGFGSDNYLTKNINILPTKSLKIHSKGVFKTNSHVLWSDNNYERLAMSGNKLCLWNIGNSQNLTLDTLTLTDGEEFECICELTPTKATITATTINGIFTKSLDITHTFNQITKYSIGALHSGTYSWLGSIDLNSFKIYVDDQLVYQPTLRIPYTQSKTGNKIVDATYRDRVQDMYEQFGYTHYYTIGDEPEKYNVTKVGSPTLVGGVASGFSSSNYLKFNANELVSATTYSIKIKFNLDSNVGTTYGCFISDKTGTSIQGMYLGFQGKKSSDALLAFKANPSSTLTNLASIQTNKYYMVEIKVSNNIAKVLLDGLQVGDDFGATDTTWSGILCIGNCTNDPLGSYATGQIDLSQFSITVDGKEVFHAYDPAVPNAYTIPTNSPNDIIYSYKDANNNSYVQRANLTVEQFGNLAANTTSATFPVPFKDTNYTLIVEPADSTSTANPTVGQVNGVRSTTGFTTLTMADKRTYKAKGKIVLG